MAPRPIVTRMGDQEVHCLEYGSGERSLLLLHGLSGSSRWWARNVTGLAGKYRLLVPDLIGFGRSRVRTSIPPIEVAAMQLADWIRTLELSSLTVVGHSMGGQLAIHLASGPDAPLDRLVLVDSAGMPRSLTFRSLARFAVEVGPMWRWGDPRFLPTIAGDALTAGPRTLLRAIWNILRDDVRPLLPHIEVPTLIIWGERDTLVPLTDAWVFREKIPGSRLAILKGAGHNPMVDRPHDFNRLLERFLDDEPVGR